MRSSSSESRTAFGTREESMPSTGWAPAVNSDGRSNGMTAPSKSAQVSVIRQALRVAGVEPSEISFVEAHGSGTLLGDGVEISSLAEVFGADRELHPACGRRGQDEYRHLLAAAWIAGFIKAVLSVRQSVTPSICI